MAAKLGGGGGKKAFDLGQNSEINVTPFVDVMLVLLTKPPTYLSIDDKGQLFVSFSTSPTTTEMRPATLDDMAGLIASSLGVANPTNEQVFIRADQHVKYGVFMAVVNKLQLDGYYKIGLISEEVQPE